MMKKFIKFSLLGCFIVLFCSGCKGDVTRAIRHAGYTLSGDEFKCNAFFNDEGLTEDIMFFTGSHIITNYGRIYDVSLGQKYSNGQNCMAAETSIKAKSIMDGVAVRGDDGRYYRLSGDNNSTAYSEILSSDSNYALYSLLLGPADVLKVTTVDSGTGTYYVLKTDGTVYGYSVNKGDRNTNPYVAGQTPVFSKTDYGGDIIDFGYYGDSPSTYVRTVDSVYHYVMDNSDECKKYADVKCTYHMEEDAMFAKQSRYISAYNGSTIITTYNKVFTLNAS